MKRKLIALALICIMLIGAIALAEQDRPRLDTADCIVYRITNGKYRIMDMGGRFLGEDYDAFPSDRIGETAVYMDHGRYGYVAKDGTILIEPDYLELPRFENGYAVVRKEDIEAAQMVEFSGGPIRFPDICGIIDAYGDIVVPIAYSNAYISFDENYAIVGVVNDGSALKCLFDLKQGKELFEPRYYSIESPNLGTAAACERTVNRDAKNSSGDEYIYRYGIIDVNGNALAPFDYDRIEYSRGCKTYSCYIGDDLIKTYENKDGNIVEKAD